MVFTTAISIGLSLLAVHLRRANTQRLAVRALGGHVFYRDERASSGWHFNYEHRDPFREGVVPVFHERPQGAASWLGDLLGEDFFRTVVAARVWNDKGMADVRRLPYLRELDLWNTDVTDVGLAELRGMSRLEGLALGSIDITDGGLPNLQGLTHLSRLCLANARIGDAGLCYLSGLVRLQTLDLSRTQIGDAGLPNLGGLSRLQTLDLSQTKITGAGLSYLECLTQLRSLGLCRCPITDAAGCKLGVLVGLQQLDLSCTDAGDRTLQHLSGLRNLEKLSIWGTKATREGVKRFRRALPSCTVVASDESGSVPSNKGSGFGGGAANPRSQRAPRSEKLP
jgi:hypothetical protein